MKSRTCTWSEIDRSLNVIPDSSSVKEVCRKAVLHWLSMVVPERAQQGQCFSSLALLRTTAHECAVEYFNITAEVFFFDRFRRYARWNCFASLQTFRQRRGNRYCQVFLRHAPWGEGSLSLLSSWSIARKCAVEWFNVVADDRACVGGRLVFRPSGRASAGEISLSSFRTNRSMILDLSTFASFRTTVKKIKYY